MCAFHLIFSSFQIFQEVKSILPEEPRIQEIMSAFQTAISNAGVQVFPDVTMKGCAFCWKPVSVAKGMLIMYLCHALHAFIFILFLNFNLFHSMQF